MLSSLLYCRKYYTTEYNVISVFVVALCKVNWKSVIVWCAAVSLIISSHRCEQEAFENREHVCAKCCHFCLFCTHHEKHSATFHAAKHSLYFQIYEAFETVAGICHNLSLAVEADYFSFRKHGECRLQFQTPQELQQVFATFSKTEITAVKDHCYCYCFNRQTQIVVNAGYSSKCLIYINPLSTTKGQGIGLGRNISYLP